jgi:hypothetical protein
MFEGLIAIIEAWLTREMSDRRWAAYNNRGPLNWETIDDVHSLDVWADLGDLRDVYTFLEQAVDRIHERDQENT